MLCFQYLSQQFIVIIFRKCLDFPRPCTLTCFWLISVNAYYFIWFPFLQLVDRDGNVNGLPRQFFQYHFVVHAELGKTLLRQRRLPRTTNTLCNAHSWWSSVLFKHPSPHA